MTENRTEKRRSTGAGEPGSRDPRDVTVLVVDDEPDVVAYFSSVLEDAGLNVLTAYDGDQALKILAEHEVDLISLDLVMPRKSGIRLFVELRRKPNWSRIPVVFVTGHAKDPDVRRDVEQVMADSTMAGPSMYLEKPVTPRSYLSHICRIVGVRQQPEPEEPDRIEKLRREAGSLLETADAETIEALLKGLKKRT